jgi:hypothetical protein
MFKSISIFPALVLAALALFVVGCGGSDDTTSSKGDDSTLAKSENDPLSKAEFTKQAEDVCYQSKRSRYFEARKYQRRHREELKALSPIAAYEKEIVAVVLPSIMKEAQELTALGAPKGDEKKIEAIVTGIEAGVKKAEKNPYSVSLEVPSEYPFRKVGYLIRAYGLVDCRNVA